jgi:Cu/Zn superoxide dismutase
MRRQLFIGLAGAAAFVLASAVPAAAASVRVVQSSGPLSDLSIATVDGTDGARASALAVVGESQTVVVLNLRGLTDGGAIHGAHVHTGACVAGEGATAGPHYNAGGGISASTEVWLDFEVRDSGNGHAVAIVPFGIAAGAARSIVIHAAPTDPATGAAGARLACLPLEF